MKVKNRELKTGDALYHRRLGAWVTVVSPGVVSTDAGYTMQINEGGFINGRRELYWHEPLDIDLPSNDISAYQDMVDALKKVLGHG